MVNKLSKGDSLNQQNVLENIQNHTQDVLCRIFFVRHGISVDEANRWKDSKQLWNADLHSMGEAQMEQVSAKLKKMWCNKEDTLILYSSGKNQKKPINRIVRSVNILKKNEIWVLKQHHALDTSEKVQLPDWNIVIKDWRLFTRVEQFYNILQLTNNEILKSFTWENKLDYNKYKNIVLLGHKSNAWISEVTKKEWQTIELCKNKINTWDIWQFDINKNNEYVNYEKESDVLCLNYQNIAEIFSVFRKEEVLRKYIESFFKKELNLFELQNIINTYFKQNPKLYEKYLTVWNIDLTLFCLANLVGNLEIDIVRKNTKDLIQNQESQLKTIFDLIMTNNPDIKIYEFFIKELFSLRKKYELTLPDNLICYIRDKAKSNKDFLLIMNYYENIYSLVEEIRSKSLDMRIVNWEDIEPEFNFDWDDRYLKDFLEYPKRIDERNKQLEADDFRTRISIDFPSRHISNRSVFVWDKIQYIEADAWSWKSFLLSKINEDIKNVDFMIWSDAYFPIFLSLSWIGKATDVLSKIKQIELNYFDKKDNDLEKTLILDSLDESLLSEYEIKSLFEHLVKFSGKIVITSRKWYLPKWNQDKNEDRNKVLEKINIIQLKEIQDIDWYVKKYFANKENWDKKLDNFNLFLKNQWLNGIEKNPLILSMICFLIDTWEDIEKISTISDLYERIIDLRLLNRENNKQGKRKISVNNPNSFEWQNEMENIIDKRKDFLWKLAYKSIFEWINIDEQQFNNIKRDYPWIISDDACLNLIFRKNENKEYDFVHQSFKEYFAAKEFVNQLSIKINKEVELYLEDVVFNKLELVNNWTLKFLIDILNKKENSGLKKTFLDYIYENRNFYGNIKDKIIYMLYSLDVSLFEKYTSSISFDSKLLDDLIENALFLKEQWYIDFLKSIIRDDYQKLSSLVTILGEIWWEETIEFIKSLKDKENLSLKLSLLNSLWKIWWQENVDFIKSFVNDPFADVRHAVIEILWQIWWEENIKFIKSLHYKNPSLSFILNDMKNRLDGIKNHLNDKRIGHLASNYNKEDIDYSAIKKIIQIISNVWWEENIEFIKSFKKAKNCELRISVIEWLWKIWWEENIEFIKSFKDDKNCHVRSSLIQVLWRIWWEENIKFIKSFKNDTNRYVKCSLIETLWEVWWKKNIKFIKLFKDDKNCHVRASLIETLWEIWWEENITIIKSFKNDEDPRVRVPLIKVLWKIWWEENIDLIKSFKHYTSSLVKDAVIDALCNIWGLENLIVARSIANNPYDNVKIIQNLWKIWWEENIEFIKSYSNSLHTEIIFEIINVLWEIWWEENMLFIRSLAEDQWDFFKVIPSSIIQLLWEIWWEENINFIKSFNDNADEILRASMVEALWKIWWEENINFIKVFKDDKDSAVRESLIRTLWKVWWEENINFIKSFRNDRVYWVRWALIETLWEIWWEENINFIKLFKNDKNHNVRQILINTLNKIWWEENVDFLRSLSEENYYKVKNRIIEMIWLKDIEFIKSLKYNHSHVIRAAVIEILWEIWWEENIEFIKTFEDNEDDYVINKLIEVLWKIWWKENMEFIKSFLEKKYLETKDMIINIVWWNINNETIEWIKNLKYTDNRFKRAVVIEILWEFWWKENIEFIKSFKDDEDYYVINKLIEVLWKIWWKDNINFIQSIRK